MQTFYNKFTLQFKSAIIHEFIPWWQLVWKKSLLLYGIKKLC